MGNCQQLCNPTPSFTDLPQAKRTQGHPSEIAAQQFILKCQICGQDRKDSTLKNHLDYIHFAEVKETGDGQFEVVCLLCDFKSVSLEQHRNHLRHKHTYMETQSRQNLQQEQRGSRLQLNYSIKKRVTPVNKLDLYVKPDYRSADIGGQNYAIETYQKEYGAMEFNEDSAKGDLVWRYIFSICKDASYYSIQFVPKQKSILAVSKIFRKQI